MTYQKKITSNLKAAARTLDDSAGDPRLVDTVSLAAEKIIGAYKGGNKVLFCGNGGSAADAQHLAAELSGKFYLDRPPLPAEALHANASYLTAVANDYSYDKVYSRAIEASGKKGDVLVAISTSGNSENIISALKTARRLGLATIGLTKNDGGKFKGLCDILICAPSADTPRVQEAHIAIGHTICEIVEETLFKK
jgi:D-sedoheptulose 7-phosphate isomerase